LSPKTRAPAKRAERPELLFGNRTARRESTRDRNVPVRLVTTPHDLRYALRGMRRRPRFTSAAVLSPALGIGADTAILTLLQQRLPRKPPVPNARESGRTQNALRFLLTVGEQKAKLLEWRIHEYQ